MNNQYNNPKYKSTISKLKKELTKLQKEYGDDLSLEDRRAMTDRYSIDY